MNSRSTRLAALGRWLLLAVALYALNLSLSFHNVWPTPLVEDRQELSVEMALLLLALGLAAEFGALPGRRLLGATTALLLLLVLGRYAEVTAPALFGRAINLYWDAQYLPAVAAMLGRAAPPWQVALLVLALLALLCGIWLLLRWCLGRVWWALSQPAPRRLVTALAGLLVLVYYGGYLGLPWRPAGWYSLPVSATYAEQAGFLVKALTGGARAESLPPSPGVESDLARARDSDVFIVFVESYGAVTYDNRVFAATLAPRRARLAKAVEEGGRRVVSAIVDVPTTGGGSWLSHASLLSGIEVRDQGAYSLLLTQQRRTLVGRFSATGHRALGLMPGMRSAWPEGAFYGFDDLYDAERLEYAGPAFAWWRIPDQYALARLTQLELGELVRAPRMVVFPTISSHAPFRPTPPYQPDWQRVLETQPFGASETTAALSVSPDWNNLGPGYVASIAYAHDWLAGWLRQPGTKPLLAVVLGDHQPPAAVAGPDAPWQVPVHVVTSDPGLAQALQAGGFSQGLQPIRAAIGNLSDLHVLLLRALDSAL